MIRMFAMDNYNEFTFTTLLGEFCMHLDSVWEQNFTIKCYNEDHSTICIQANKEGLISLANILLKLSQDDVPEFSHVHLDENNCLENGSNELIIVKKDF